MTQPVSMPAASTALRRFKVIDLSRVRSGPTASRQLADWGADVISVEQPTDGVAAEPHVGPRNGPDFQNLNRNRRSITLDLKQPDGVAILRRLVADADVLIENFRPAVKERLGIGYAAMSEVNPRLVYASISGFGQDGPYRDRPCFDQIAQAMAGLMSVTGHPGETPLRVGIPIADLSSGLFCAFGVLVALLEREVSGKGQWVKTSLVQSLAFLLDFQAARYLRDGVVARPHGNHHPTIVPTGSFRTADGFVSLAIVGQTMWERFCDALGRPDWREAADYATNGARLLHQQRLHAEIEQALAGAGNTHWVAHFNAHQVPCGPIYSIDQMFNDPHIRTLGMVQQLQDAHGSASYLAQPIELSRTPSAIVRHPPEAGQHTDEVLASLAFTEQDIAALRAARVV